MGKRRVGPPDRRRVAETFENPDHPMIDEIAGPFTREEIDPRVPDGWYLGVNEDDHFQLYPKPTGRAIERVFARIVAAVSNRS